MPTYKVGLTGKADAEGGTSTVTLNASNSTWTATNDTDPKLLENLNGNYVSGTNLYPGFATKGTALVIAGMSIIDEDALEAFLYNYVPEETVKSGEAHMLKTGSLGNWTRK